MKLRVETINVNQLLSVAGKGGNSKWIRVRMCRMILKNTSLLAQILNPATCNVQRATSSLQPCIIPGYGLPGLHAAPIGILVRRARRGFHPAKRIYPAEIHRRTGKRSPPAKDRQLSASAAASVRWSLGAISGWQTRPERDRQGIFRIEINGRPHRCPAHEEGAGIDSGLGGAERCNTYSKFYLAALGQMHYDSVPVIPPELVLLAQVVLFPSGQGIRMVTHHDHAAGGGFELSSRPPVACAQRHYGAIRQATIMCIAR